MGMTEKTITAQNADNQLKELYETAFPVEEQIPWSVLLRLIDEMPLYFTAYYKNEEFIGFTIVYPYKSYNWFWYFAVKEEFRGKGFGQEILSNLIEKYSDKNIILDMESPYQPGAKNIDQRMRRLEFYSRNGFHDTHAHKFFDGIEYTIMLHGDGVFTVQDYDAIISDLRRFWQTDDSKE